MSYESKIILDSINSNECRLTTFEISIPKFVQADLNTHRMLSRNSASSRAIPSFKMIDRVRNDSVEPVEWGLNQPGMQASELLGPEEQVEALSLWRSARDACLWFAEQLADKRIHKQLVNRIIEPWMFVSVIITATEWHNFFKLRTSRDAQPELAKVARLMKEQYEANTPLYHANGSWHMPYLGNDIFDCKGDEAQRVSAARCARVSYLTHDGKRDVASDLALYARLSVSGHWSPMEHVAESMPNDKPYGNFFGWRQLRQVKEAESEDRSLTRYCRRLEAMLEQ